MGSFYAFSKAFMDFFLASFMLIFLSPLIGLLALIVLLGMGRPVFFTQVRIGKCGKSFNMFKFRSMTNETDNQGQPLSNVKRLTRLGIWLRKTSLDELPQLWNVLKRDMSLVGPRPLLPEYLPYYTEQEMKRHTVLPGITGWAQINGRHHLNWEDRLAMDVFYTEQQSLWFDVKILLHTFLYVLFQRHNTVLQEYVLEDFVSFREKTKGE